MDEDKYLAVINKCVERVSICLFAINKQSSKKSKIND